MNVYFANGTKKIVIISVGKTEMIVKKERLVKDILIQKDK